MTSRGSHPPTREEIATYLPVVRKLVSQFRRRLPESVTTDELSSAGMYGLFDALRKGGAEQGPGFNAYVRTRVRGAIVDELRSRDSLSRGARREARQEGAQTVTHINVDELVGGYQVADQSSLTPDVRVDCGAVVLAIESLPARERFVINEYYLRESQLSEIAEVLRVSEARVSQLRARGVIKLRSILAAKMTDAKDAWPKKAA